MGIGNGMELMGKTKRNAKKIRNLEENKMKREFLEHLEVGKEWKGIRVGRIGKRIRRNGE